MKPNKVLPALLSLGLTMGLTTGTILANDGAEDGTTVGTSGMEVSKTAVLNDDGTYTIQLSAYATGETSYTHEELTKPLDIVIVVDQSSSMEPRVSQLKNAVRSFVNTISKNANENNADHKVAIAGFTGGTEERKTGLFVNGDFKQYESLVENDYKNALVSVNDSNGNVTSSITNAISNFAYSGNTYPAIGLEMANNVFENNQDQTRDSQKVVVLFTDGNPCGAGTNVFDDEYAAEAVNEAYITKNTWGAKVYTVGFYDQNIDQTKMANMMNAISSNYPDAKATQTTDKEYVKVNKYDISTKKTYYVLKNGSYVEVSYKPSGWFGGSWQDSDGNTYKPNNTTFYSYETITKWDIDLGNQAGDQYYMSTDKIDDLANIFESISQDIVTPSTSVKYGANSVLKDIIGQGFTATDKTTVTLSVNKGTADEKGNISVEENADVQDTPEFKNQNGENLVVEASQDGNTITVSGFNYSNNYIAPAHDGYRLNVSITNIIPDDTTAIYNAQTYTNDEASGIYEDETPEANSIKFPRPTTILTEKAYVVDYAKKIQLKSVDWKMLSTPDMYGSYAKSDLAAQFGKFNGLTYEPTTTVWNGFDKAYAFGKSDEKEVTGKDANKNGNLWSRVSVLPANSVYYEDTFTSDTNNGVVGIEFTGSWNTNTDGNASDSYDPETNKTHGAWSDTGVNDSDNTSTGADAAKGAAKASFKFTGTGVDIYSRTSMESGTILVKVTSEDGSTYKKRFIVDTKSFSSDEGSYYSIPTFSVSDLAYGNYTVDLTVTTAASAEGRTKYYIDGIRVYNPLGDGAAADNIGEAYAGEFNAQFTPIKSLVGGDSIVFIDEVVNEDGTSAPVLGGRNDHPSSPNHEVYLANGQSVVMNVANSKGTNPDRYYIGLKTPDGQSTQVKINGTAVTINSSMDLYYEVTPSDEGTITIQNAESNNEDGTVNFVSLTKMRTAYDSYHQSAEMYALSPLSEEAALQSYNMTIAGPTGGLGDIKTEDDFNDADVPATEENSENNMSDLTGDDVQIDNPSEDVVDSDKDNSGLSSIDRLFAGLGNLFCR